jgi:NAD(P)-dependent dehydrogenase (short-subunit alcohol dehydrogenase family)
MVELKTVRALNTALVQRQPLVAVFFGGTSGIGSYTLRALATAEAASGGRGLRAYIVGRKVKAAEEIIAECRALYPTGEFKFVKVDDLALMEAVDRVCVDIIRLEEKEGQSPRIDYLMLSHACIPYLPRKGIFKLQIPIETAF